jgi:hypothetical protein
LPKLIFVTPLQLGFRQTTYALQIGETDPDMEDFGGYGLKKFSGQGKNYSKIKCPKWPEQEC